MYEGMDRTDLYLEGIEKARRFLRKNGIDEPIFCTYKQVETTQKVSQRTKDYFRRATTNGRIQGTGTGLYYEGTVFVNVEVTALPVKRPGMRNWSYPGYKVDRTAIGVVAHEVGHYVEEWLRRHNRIDLSWGKKWIDLIQSSKKMVSGYEPVPDEAWAESMRLFVLNPDLLRRGIPARYRFIRDLGLKRSILDEWDVVLDNDAYHMAAAKWMRT